jgi:hypothetical protein
MCASQASDSRSRAPSDSEQGASLADDRVCRTGCRIFKPGAPLNTVDAGWRNDKLAIMPIRNLTKADILAGLTRLSELAQKEGVVLEVSLYGGALMMLAYDARQSTKDVDAIIRPPAVGRRLVVKVAQERGWHDDWLNDEVKQFVSTVETRDAWTPPGLNAPAIKITKPTAKYLLAMKVMACRRALPGYAGDEADIAFLLNKLVIKSAAEVERIVDKYFPDTVLPAATHAVLEKLLSSSR